MKRINTSRQAIAARQRITPHSTACLIANTDLGAGIANQSVKAAAGLGVVERVHESGAVYYEVESVKFPGRYYIAQPLSDGSWNFTGNPKLARKYIALAQEYIAAQEMAKEVEALEDVNIVDADEMALALWEAELDQQAEAEEALTEEIEAIDEKSAIFAELKEQYDVRAIESRKAAANLAQFFAVIGELASACNRPSEMATLAKLVIAKRIVRVRDFAGEELVVRVKQDLPEWHVKAGEEVRLRKSSYEGYYYLVQFVEASSGHECTCIGFEARNQCKHANAVAKAATKQAKAKLRAMRSTKHSATKREVVAERRRDAA